VSRGKCDVSQPFERRSFQPEKNGRSIRQKYPLDGHFSPKRSDVKCSALERSRGIDVHSRWKSTRHITFRRSSTGSAIGSIGYGARRFGAEVIGDHPEKGREGRVEDGVRAKPHTIYFVEGFNQSWNRKLLYSDAKQDS
jgi:hypothetical protein